MKKYTCPGKITISMVVWGYFFMSPSLTALTEFEKVVEIIRNSSLDPEMNVPVLLGDLKKINLDNALALLNQEKNVTTRVAVKYALLKETRDAPAPNINTLYLLKNENNKTLLHVAAEYNLVAFARFLVNQGALVDVQEGLTGFTPLHYALSNNAIKMIEYLLKKKAAFTKLDAYQRSPLMVGIIKVQEQAALFLLKKAYEKFFPPKKYRLINKKDKEGNTALHHAILKEQSRIVEALFLQYADFFIQNNESKTPVDLMLLLDEKVNSGLIKLIDEIKALALQRGEELKKLIENPYGASKIRALEEGMYLTAKIGSNYDSPLHYAVQLKKPWHLQALLEYGMNGNMQNRDGDSPLHLAAKSECKSPVEEETIFKIIELLLTAGVDRYLRNNNGREAAWLAQDTDVAQYIQQENPWERKKIYLRWLLVQFKKQPVLFFRPLLEALADLVGISGAMKWMWKTVTGRTT